jgi:predicted metal-binding transcription factor (methanogenesis marker protein 9)
MRPAKRNNTIVDAYASLLSNLSHTDKMELVSRLGEAAEVTSRKRKSTFRKAFGAFVSEKSAEEIIEDIRGSRVSIRQIEPF